MKINKKSLELVEKGLSPKTVTKLTESQINELHKKMVSEQSPTTTSKGTTYVSSKNPNAAGIAKDLNAQGINVSMTEKKEVGESKKKGKKENEPNPLAICHAQVGPKKTRKFERCVMAVKKSLAEGKNPVSLFLESQIMKIVEKNLPPKITKGDLIDYLIESSTTAPAKPKTKPSVKPDKGEPKKKPGHPGKNPNPGEKIAPKAGVDEDTTTAPSKPKTKPETKPGKPAPKPRPGHPGKNPNPGENPAPKAISPERAKDEVINAIMKMLEK
jgi:hypothetical protein